MTTPHASRQHPALLPGKFLDPDFTAFAENQGKGVAGCAPWFNTGTLCNLTCANCYIGFSPRNDRLAYPSRAEVARDLQEISRRGLPTRLIGFTGGEPFMNPDRLRRSRPPSRWMSNFIPTSASRINAVENLFSFIARKRTFTSLADLHLANQSYIRDHKRDPRPLVWT